MDHRTAAPPGPPTPGPGPAVCPDGVAWCLGAPIDHASSPLAERIHQGPRYSMTGTYGTGLMEIGLIRYDIGRDTGETGLDFIGRGDWPQLDVAQADELIAHMAAHLARLRAVRDQLAGLTTAPPARCPAAHPEDPTQCDGPVAVTVLDRHTAGADGCEHHAGRLLASLTGGRVYALPDAPGGSAVRVHRASGLLQPFCWAADTAGGAR